MTGLLELLVNPLQLLAKPTIKLQARVHCGCDLKQILNLVEKNH